MRNDTVEIPAYALDESMFIELTPSQLDRFDLLGVRNDRGLWSIVTLDHYEKGVQVSNTFRLDDGFSPWDEDWAEPFFVRIDNDELVRVLPTWMWQ